ncbi:MAG: hypothetical protein EZS28_052763, partial [Streblomastix strix]
LDSEAYDTLAKKLSQYSSKLIKRPDQARAALLCAHLFWNERDGVSNQCKDAASVLLCLKRVGDIATKSQQFIVQVQQSCYSLL